MIANVYEQSTGLNCAPTLDQSDCRNKPDSSYLDEAEWLSFHAGFGVFAEAQAIRSLEFDKQSNKFAANYSI